MKGLLQSPHLLRLFNWLLGAERSRRLIVEQYLRPTPGMTILDFGCALGDVVTYCPSVDYTGIDLSEDYIRYARKNFGDTGKFIHGNVLTTDIPSGAFDLCLCLGFLHHLDEGSCKELLARAQSALKASGRFVAVEACLTPDQHWFARLMAKNDRGQFVRDADGYVRLIADRFPNHKVSIRNDLLRIPYTYCIIETWNGATPSPNPDIPRLRRLKDRSEPRAGGAIRSSAVNNVVRVSASL